MNKDSYNAIAPSWDAARTAFFGREREYVDTLLDGQPVPSRILDLGCGTGRPLAEYILARGHDVTGVDQATELLDRARSRFPAGHWIESRIEDFVPETSFAAVVCWDALFHIERSVHEPLIRRIAGWLEPGGKLMLTVGGSDHPAFTDTMYDRTFFYDSHPPEAALSLLKTAGFEPVLTEFLNPPTDGRDKGRFGIVARRI